MNHNFTLIDRYKLRQRLGNGTYGSVYLADDIQENQQVAIKMFHTNSDDDGIQPNCIREISLLKQLHHQYIVQLKNIIVYNQKIYMIMEYCDSDLSTFMYKLCQQNNLNHGQAPQTVNQEGFYCVLPQRQIKKIIYEQLLAIYYCHANRIIHRDIKPQNILVKRKIIPNSQNFEIETRLTDFGLAREISLPLRQYTHDVVTLWYRCAEVILNGKHYTPAIDIWSIGCIMSEIARNGQPLFQGSCEIQMLFSIFQVLGTPSRDQDPYVREWQDFQDVFPHFQPIGLEKLHKNFLDDYGIDLLKGLLQLNPINRVTAKQALRHPWFDSIRDEYN